MAKKGGARKSEQNKIRKLKEQGLDAEEISDALRINIKTVRSFMDFDPLAKKEEEPKLTEDQMIEITDLAADEDNTAESIADALDIELSLVEDYLESEK